jgi:hypothetical protein
MHADVKSPSTAAMCSLNAERSRCERACGLGAVLGSCEWRATSQRLHEMAHDYSTCSPSIATCPDNHCDELESMFPSICPQDCISECLCSQEHQNNLDIFHIAEEPNGPHKMNHDSHQNIVGIKTCLSPVWCSSEKTCHCTPNMSVSNLSRIGIMPQRNHWPQVIMNHPTPASSPEVTDGPISAYSIWVARKEKCNNHEYPP